MCLCNAVCFLWSDDVVRHEAAEARGLVSHSFGEGESRYMVIYKPEAAPPAEVLAEAETEEDIPLLMERYRKLQEELAHGQPEQVPERVHVRKARSAIDAPPARGELLVLPSIKKERYSVAETLAERGKKKQKLQEQLAAESQSSANGEDA